MGLAITEVPALPDSASRRIWFHLEEFDALGPLQGLKDAQARLRKKGGCVVIGLQSIDQVRAIYGAAAANTIIENGGNVLILRCGSSERGGTAPFASELTGEREVGHDETTTSRSKGKEHTTSSTAKHVRRRTGKAVLASRIVQLADRSGHLRLAGEAEWKKVPFDYVEFQAGTEPYVPGPAPRREAGKGGADGEPCLDAHDAALRQAARGPQPRRGGEDRSVSIEEGSVAEIPNRPPAHESHS